MANSGIVRLLHRLATWVAGLPKRLAGPVPLVLSVSETTDLTAWWQVLQPLPVLALCRYPAGTAAAYLPFPNTECCISECLLVTAGREEQEIQLINHDFKCAMSVRILSPALKLEQPYVWKATSGGTNIKHLINDHRGLITIMDKLILVLNKKSKSILFDFSGLYSQQSLKWLVISSLVLLFSKAQIRACSVKWGRPKPRCRQRSCLKPFL